MDKQDQFSSSILELKSLEREILNHLRILKEKQDDNTTRQELTVKKKLDEFSGKVIKLFNEYQNNTKLKSSLYLILLIKIF